MKPKLIWKGTIRDAIREGRLTQEQLDEWNLEEGRIKSAEIRKTQMRKQEGGFKF